MSETEYMGSDDLDAMDRRYRVNLVNSLTGFKSANLVGTSSTESGINNLALFTSAVHIGADPALIGIISRPDSVSRDTLNNIRENKTFTLNHVHEGILTQAHQTSARYPSDVSEFVAVGLTPEYLYDFEAPFVRESRIKVGLSLVEIQPVKINGTYIVIGEVKVIVTPKDAMHYSGRLNPESAGSLVVSSLDTWHGTQRKASLTYAKPDQPVRYLEDDHEASRNPGA